MSQPPNDPYWRPYNANENWRPPSGNNNWQPPNTNNWQPPNTNDNWQSSSNNWQPPNNNNNNNWQRQPQNNNWQPPNNNSQPPNNNNNWQPPNTNNNWQPSNADNNWGTSNTNDNWRSSNTNENWRSSDTNENWRPNVDDPKKQQRIKEVVNKPQYGNLFHIQDQIEEQYLGPVIELIGEIGHVANGLSSALEAAKRGDMLEFANELEKSLWAKEENPDLAHTIANKARDLIRGSDN